MIRMTTEQWIEVVKILGSYRADLLRDHASDAEEHIAYIEEIIDEITESQDDWEVEFTLDAN